MKIAALAGGVGGSKLVHGLAQILAPEDLTIIVNTADDFRHFGLRICPDLDTVCYTLSGQVNAKTGWGRADDTWQAMRALEEIGGPTWFRLGDLDLATHLERTRRIEGGASLSEVVAAFCKSWGVLPCVLPMTDQSVSTIVHTDEGELEFQDYFVRRGCTPQVKRFEFRGVQSAKPAPGVIEALRESDAIIVCPSNPWVSIAPILAIPGILQAINPDKAVAISPIVAGSALRGPAAKMYSEMGIRPSAVAVAFHYREFVQRVVIDERDRALASEIEALGQLVRVVNTIMDSVGARRRLASDVLDFLRAGEK
jgi:LPPG:FO 2-phospho-L-lactate transferase